MSLKDCPDEIIQNLLYYVSPEDNLLNFQLLSRRLNRIANSGLLWRHHCHNVFKFWNPDHDFQHKLEGPPTDVSWKELFILRKQRNARIANLFDGMLATKAGKITKFEQICLLGYDAKDFLLDQYYRAESTEDELARRYYSNAVLRSIGRGIAIEEWLAFHRNEWGRPGGSYDPPGSGVRIERALAAFDMFFLPIGRGEMSDISRMLDDLADRFKTAEPTFEAMTTRNKALELNRWLRENDLTGMHNPTKTYRYLRNCLIGHALRDEGHSSLPIISVAIFCCVAERLGLNAQCCTFPGHMQAMVFAKEGEDMDGNPFVSTEQEKSLAQRMYLDPYGSNDEVTIQALRDTLVRLGWPGSDNTFMEASSPVSLIYRTAQNINATYAEILEGNSDPNLTTLPDGDYFFINMDTAHYAACWALLLATPPTSAFATASALKNLLRTFSSDWHGDAWLIEKYVGPMFDYLWRDRSALHNRDWTEYRSILESVREADQLVPRTRCKRQTLRPPQALFTIGQVFRHNRYGHYGIITGYEELPSHDTSSTSRNEDCCYNYMKPDGRGNNVVLESNIGLVEDPRVVPAAFFSVAGAFFKRFDQSTCSFIK